MRSFNTNSPVLRSSVASVFAVTVISLIAWSFESYRDHLWESRNPTTAAIQAQITSDRDTRNA